MLVNIHPRILLVGFHEGTILEVRKQTQLLTIIVTVEPTLAHVWE